jgi:YD repeat-containing protein
MRSVVLLLALAACTNSGAQAMACSPLTCQGPRCLLSTAEQDTTLCPASEQKCAGETIIREMGTDTSTEYYYNSSGKLVAEVHTGINRETCSGPALFEAPSCATDEAPLVVCLGMP